jgi:putative chitinase
MITLQQLQHIYKDASAKRVETFYPHIVQTMEKYEILNPQRKRMFLAQIGHESGQLRYVEEIASGQAYEFRADLGNIVPGDGPKYKGRGLIQITGKTNYLLCGVALDLDLLSKPEILLLPKYAAMSAGWFWYNKNLNSLADLGLFRDITKRINGGYNGYADRYKLYQRAFEVIS